MNDAQWDKKLKIQTQGRDASSEDVHHHPYEPTPYCVLERLTESGYISDDDRVIDYGCGKGRVSFYLNKHTGCQITGVEFDPSIYEAAMDARL